MNRGRRWRPWEQVLLLPQFGKWLLLSSAAALLAGTASAGFLIALDAATDWRESNPWIIACLPLGGFLIGWIYHRYGVQVEGGNNLILDEIHDPRKIVPLRMTPLVLLGTVGSHFFGGSAGREGTAVQMGGSLADQISFLLRLKAEDRRILLMAGVSAGFASVFGTPLAGAVFGLEVLAIGRLRYDAILPCFAAAILADQVTLAWGVRHAAYPLLTAPGFSIAAFSAAILAGAMFGIVGMLFARTTHRISSVFRLRIRYAPLRPVIGGAIVALAVWTLGSTRYVGLGLPVIEGSFAGEARPWDFAAKFLFTAVTLGSGFKGGEVTPLFFIGATLGAALSPFLGLPLPLCAGMGFVAVFAGAANTPIASTLMAVELFGPQAGIYAGVACVASYLFSGHAGIYQAQRIGQCKQPHLADQEGSSLASLARTAALPIADLGKDVHYLGYFSLPGKEPLSRLRILRIYFRLGAKAPAEGLLGRLAAPPLGEHLAAAAKALGIDQFVLYRVTVGFLKGDPVSVDVPEVQIPALPQCAEMVDHEEKLRAFLRENGHLLEDARIVMLRFEEPLQDSLRGPGGASSGEPAPPGGFR